MRALSSRPVTKALLRENAARASYTSPISRTELVFHPLFFRRRHRVKQQYLHHAHTASTATSSSIPLHTGLPLPDRKNDTQAARLRSARAVQQQASAWAEIVEEFLPAALRKPAGNEPTPPGNITYQHTVLTRLLLDAWRVNVDVLSHFGIEEGRWEAMLWLSQVLVDTSPPPSRTPLEANAVSNLKWPSHRTLDDLTQTSFELNYDQLINASKHESLKYFTVYGESAWQVSPQRRGQQALGYVWQTLGRLIIVAAERDSEGSNTIMAYVLRIIANLHHRGWIPEKTYQYNPSGDPSALQQPPLLHSLAQTMLSSLSDNDYQSVWESGSDARPLLDASSLLQMTSSGQNLGPELWMEFVLWCCVHGPWVTDGAAIVVELYKLKKSKRWSLICWRDIMESPDSKWDEYSRRRLDAKQVEAGSPITGNETLSRSRTIVERTISTEVVIALIDGLLTSLTRTESAESGLSLTEIQNRIATLKAVLERDKMSLGLSTWDAAITRFADCPDLQIENNPQLMEIILSLAETYGREVSSANAPHESGKPVTLATYVFDASAATIGLYHRTLQAFIKFRDMSGALRLLARLQTLTDANKRGSLEAFFKKLNATRFDPLNGSGKIHGVKTKSSTSMFPGVQYPGFYPDIPVNILADLLDLISDSGSTELGQWMIYSDDVDGPLISEDLYGHQLMAPALIRFAATTSDASLLSKLVRAQTTSISGRTLVALCDSRIRESNWSGAANVLSLIRDHSLHAWSTDDFSTLIRPLLAHLAYKAQDRQHASFTQASTLLQKLLRGDLGQVWGPRFSQLDTIVAIVASINPILAELCTGLLIPGKQYRVDLGTFPFNNILQGAVNAFGSRTGRSLWETWCLGTAQSREIEFANDSDSHSAAEDSREALLLDGLDPDRDEPSAKIETENTHEVDTTDEENQNTIANSSVTKRPQMSIAESFGQLAVNQSKSGVLVGTDRIISDQIKLARANIASANALLDVEVSLVGQDKHGNARPSATFDGYMTRQISTLRIIIQQALAEHRTRDVSNHARAPLGDTSRKQETRRHEVLDWAGRVLGEDFGYPAAQIQVELEGYLSSLNLDLLTEKEYSKQTLQIWTAFSGSWKQWVLSREEKLRHFALNKAERQVVIEDVPAAERYFLHCLAADFGLVSESFGDAPRRAVVISKTPSAPKVPSRTVDEVMRQRDRKAY